MKTKKRAKRRWVLIYKDWESEDAPPSLHAKTKAHALAMIAMAPDYYWINRTSWDCTEIYATYDKSDGHWSYDVWEAIDEIHREHMLAGADNEN